MDVSRIKLSGRLRWWRSLRFVLALCLPIGALLCAMLGAKAQGDEASLNDADINADINADMSKAEASNARLGETEFRAVDAYINARMRSARIPGLSLAIVQGDQIAYLKGFGRADAAGRAVTPQTPFMIGSITKPFTALAVMQLAEAGKIELDAPVQTYLPWFRVADAQASREITVRQLLNMTSGISGAGNVVTLTQYDNDDMAIERHARYAANLELEQPPGTGTIYSSANYITLGALIQSVSGLSYEEYVEQHIFAPLEMVHSYASPSEAKRDGLAAGHRWWFGFPVEAEVGYPRGDLPAGYLFSSAEDMAHFLIAQMNGGRYHDNAVLSSAGITQMQTSPSPGSYGLGWETTEFHGQTLLNHDGGNANYQASVFIDPQAHVGVFIVMNVMNALDAFSSPSGNSPVDGPTVRSMTQSVLSLVTHQPLPDPGPRIERTTLLFNAVLLALTVWLIVALLRVGPRYQRIAQRGIWSRSELLRRGGMVALLHFLWPLSLLYTVRAVPMWRELALYQPDLAYWLQSVGAVVALKGLVEEALLWRVFGKTQSQSADLPGRSIA